IACGPGGACPPCSAARALALLAAQRARLPSLQCSARACPPCSARACPPCSALLAQRALALLAAYLERQGEEGGAGDGCIRKGAMERVGRSMESGFDRRDDELSAVLVLLAAYL
ncbi:unnamed protein product, partial [Closterium sp. NIES-53]